MPEERELKDVFHIVEREGKKPIWMRIGTAFVNKDTSINVLLDALPIDGRLHIRNKRERQETKE